MLATLTEEEILSALEASVERELPLLRPVENCWQPSDVLPDMHGPNWRAELDVLRAEAATLSDEALIVLAGNLVTEEALPSYETWLNRTRGLTDPTGVSERPWGRWMRGWTAEENRHGDVLRTYLYLSGRLDMRTVEVTIQHLIRNGFDLGSDNDPYRSIVYASFQERATKISHANTGKRAEQCGDKTLGKICALIATDEARHEEAYKRFFSTVVQVDTSYAVNAFADMMRQKVAMPARLMNDGTGLDLFERFAVVAQKSGIYTTRDYSEVLQHLVDYWGIASLTGLTPEAAQNQEYLCGLADHYLKKADRIQEVIAQAPAEPFSWIFNRPV